MVSQHLLALEQIQELLNETVGLPHTEFQARKAAAPAAANKETASVKEKRAEETRAAKRAAVKEKKRVESALQLMQVQADASMRSLVAASQSNMVAITERQVQVDAADSAAAAAADAAASFNC